MFDESLIINYQAFTIITLCLAHDPTRSPCADHSQSWLLINQQVCFCCMPYSVARE